MKTLQLVYGFNPDAPAREYMTTYKAYVYLIGVNGEKLLLCKADCDDMEIRDSSWRNGALTIARHAAEKYSKFYGVKPVRMENHKIVPRSLNYSLKTRKQLGL